MRRHELSLQVLPSSVSARLGPAYDAACFHEAARWECGWVWGTACDPTVGVGCGAQKIEMFRRTDCPGLPRERRRDTGPKSRNTMAHVTRSQFSRAGLFTDASATLDFATGSTDARPSPRLVSMYCERKIWAGLFGRRAGCVEGAGDDTKSLARVATCSGGGANASIPCGAGGFASAFSREHVRASQPYFGAWLHSSLGTHCSMYAAPMHADEP